MPATDDTAASTRKDRGTGAPHADGGSKDNLGFEYRQVQRLPITLALMLSGMAAANIQMTLRHLGVEVHADTITRTQEHYFEAVQKHTETPKPPCVGDKWGCDEKHQKVRGRESYIVAVVDIATRFVLAWDVSPAKEKYDAAPLLRAAKDTAGKIPRIFITNGLGQYHIAFKKVFRTLKGLRSIHIRDIHIRSLICSTNKQERLNGGFAGRFRYARGINKESLIFRMAILRHNYIKPHGGIGGRTPAEAAGIDIRGADKWLTLIHSK